MARLSDVVKMYHSETVPKPIVCKRLSERNPYKVILILFPVTKKNGKLLLEK